MDGPVFDAMLKTALMEALEEDLKDLDTVPAKRPSVRQRRRMRRGQIPGAMPGFWLMGRNLPTGNRPEGNSGRSVGCWWR